MSLPDWLLKVRKTLQTQDNRATDFPLFAVQDKERIYGIDPRYHGDAKVAWFTWDHDPPEDDAEAAKLEAEYQEHGKERDGWTRLYYIERSVFVTACFTEEGASEYIARNRHNLKAPEVYVHGTYRNHEWAHVLKMLKGE